MPTSQAPHYCSHGGAFFRLLQVPAEVPSAPEEAPATATSVSDGAAGPLTALLGESLQAKAGKTVPVAALAGAHGGRAPSPGTLGAPPPESWGTVDLVCTEVV